MKKIFLFALVFIVLISCMKKEDEIYPIIPIPENIKIGSTGNHDTYQYWTYYDLKTNKAVMTINKAIWDIGFACSDTSLQIILNTANFMTCGNSHKTDYNQVTSSAGLTMDFDASSGNPDSNAIGIWHIDSSGFTVSKREVYVINRGVDIDGNALGYKKMAILAYSNKQFTIQFSNLNGSDLHVVNIQKDSTKNYTGLSFSGLGAPVEIEPNKNDWDVLFGQYTTMLSDAGTPYPYIVTGGMLNPQFVRALEVRESVFQTIDLAFFNSKSLTTHKDAIGYNWKLYSLTAGKYTITEGVNYLILDRNNNKYKFHFFDFYDDNGNKGFPKFEYQKL